MPVASRASAVLAIAVAVSAAALPTTTAPAAHTASTRACGLVGRFNGRLYDVRETKGNVPCRRVRHVVTRFFRTGRIRPAPGWLCFRGHGGVPWAASCARGAGVLVRVYPPS